MFSTTANHALRAATLLAARTGGEAVLGRDLAHEVSVPADYLAKVLAQLARAGVLSASRGVRGGYRLARPAEEIRLIEIVEPFDGKRVRPGCLLRPDHPCRDDGACSAHGAWSRVKTAWTTFLETTTLADIRETPGASSARRPPGKASRRRGRSNRGG